MMGGRLVPADVGEAAGAMGATMFRDVVLWHRLIQALEDASPMMVERAVATAGIAVHDLGPRKDSAEIADAITRGLAATLGSARLLSRLENSAFSELLSQLTGDRLAQAERFFFGSSGADELDALAQRWNLPGAMADKLAPQHGSKAASDQAAWAVRVAQLDENDDAWPTLEKVGALFGYEDLSLEPSNPSLDAGGLAVLSSLLGASQGVPSAESDERVRSAMDLAADPRFIWSFAESAVHAATRFRTPLSVIAIACGGDVSDEDTVSAQIATFQSIRDLVRTSDAIGLLNATHFLIVLPGTRPQGARTLAERMAHRLQTAAESRSEVYACSPHHVYSTALNQESTQRPTAEQLVQTALDGLAELKRARGGKLCGYNDRDLSIFRP